MITAGKTAVHDAGEVKPIDVPDFPDDRYKLAGHYFEITTTAVSVEVSP